MNDPFTPFRLTTVHPFLVHFTLGVVPVLLVAYGLAARRRSERWSFAGDVALGIGAASAVVSLASGLVTNAIVDWPGGIAFWRWAHLGAGSASTAALLALATTRLRAARRGAIAGSGTFVAAAGVSLLLGVTGWIGGEVLVFHAGISVTAAAQGALAPTVTRERATPAGIEAAMGRIRGAWAEAMTAHDRMLVERPTPEGYARIAAAADDLAAGAEWLERSGPQEAAEHGGPEAAATVEHLAGTFRARVAELQHAAVSGRWGDVTRSLAAVTSTCAGCHEAARWTAEAEAHHQEHHHEP